MKKIFHKNLFSSDFSKNKKTSPSKRTLALEPLEDRMLLDAASVWNDPSQIAWTSPVTDLNAFGNTTPNAVQTVDLNSDGLDDLAAVDFSSQKVSVYQNNSDGFEKLNDTTIPELSVNSSVAQAVAFFNANGQGGDDDLVVFRSNSSSSSTITADIYVRDGNTYTKYGNSISINASIENNITNFVCVGLRAFGSGTNLVLQIDSAYFTSTGSQLMCFSGLFSLSYSNNNITINKTLISEKNTSDLMPFDCALLGMVSNGTANYAAYYKASGNLNFVNINNSNDLYTWNYAAMNADLSSTQANWITSTGNGSFVLGCSSSSPNSYYVNVSFSSMSNTGFTILSTTTNENVAESKLSQAAIGKFNNDTINDLMITCNNKLVLYNGIASDTTYTFNLDTTQTVTLPAWHSVYIADVITSDGSNELGTLGKDNVNDIILVGQSNVWIIDGAKYNTTGSSVEDYLYDTKLNYTGTITSAVFDESSSGLTLIAACGYNIYLFNLSANADGLACLPDPIGSLSPKIDGKVDKIKEMRVGNFIDSSASSLAVLTGNGIFVYNISDRTQVLSNTIPVNSIGIGLGAWSVSGQLDKVVLGTVTTTKANLYLYTYENGVFTRSSEIELRGSGANANVKIYFTSGEIDSASAGNELVFLYSGTNDNKIQYIKADNTIADKLTLTGNYTYNDFYFNYVDDDAIFDFVAVANDNQGNTIIQTWLGKDNGEFSSKQENSLNGYSQYAVAFGQIDGNRSTDLVIVNDTKSWIWSNTNEVSGKSGSITVLCQSLTQAVTESYTTASGSARSWIDEWSNFYLEIWADSAASTISSFTVELDYNAWYFMLGTSDVVLVNGFTLSSKVNDIDDATGKGKLTISAASTSPATGFGTSLTEKVLLGRVYFTPSSLNDSAGVVISNEKATSVQNEFLVNTETSQFNGMVINEAADLNIPLYPVVYDLDDDGVITASDFYPYISSVYGKSTDDFSNFSYPVSINADFDKDTVITQNDVNEFNQFYGKSKLSAGYDSAYEKSISGNVAEELAYRFPAPAGSSAAPIEEITATILSSEESLQPEWSEETAAVELVAEAAPLLAPAPVTDYAVLLAVEETKNENFWDLSGEDEKEELFDNTQINEFLNRTYDRRSL